MIFDITHQNIFSYDERQKINRNFLNDVNHWNKVIDNIQYRRDADFVKLMETPVSLQVCGAMPYSIYTSASNIKNMMNDSVIKAYGRHTKGHEMSKDDLKSFPELIKKPLLVLKSDSDNTLRIITSGKNKANRDIIISVALSRNGYCTQVNKMTTGFGIVDVASYVNTMIGYGNKIIAYNTKADELLDTLRPCHLSVNNCISYNDNIPYLKEIVNIEQMQEMSKKALIEKNIIVRDEENDRK